MSNAILSRSLRKLRTSSITLPLLYPSLCIYRAASLNSAIHHGIRRSKGVGFRGKENPRTQGSDQRYGRRAAVKTWTDGSSRAPEYQKVAKTRSIGGRNAPNAPNRGRGRGSTEFKRKSFGNDTAFGEDRFRTKEPGRGITTPFRSFEKRTLDSPTRRPPSDSDRPPFPKRNSDDNDRGSGFASRRKQSGIETSVGSEQQFSAREKYPSLARKKSSFGSSPRTSYNKDINGSDKAPQYKPRREDLRSAEHGRRQYGSEEKRLDERKPRFDATQLNPGHERELRRYGSQERSFISEDRRPKVEPTTASRGDDSSSQMRIDSRMPISIPYTTPASEFLYGTSVVEAALSSRKVPRRKHYKFYIYKGDNREGSTVERDVGLERLARKNGVEVVHASGDWLRVMDKMSGGRPHNGYILEASPLPRQPVISLGQMTSIDGQIGFQVNLDHQSREEALVNGTDDFIKCLTKIPGRKPLVLLLDSIVDPGNLGGIIRTASFLGVTAIAVSTRNSASFTSVVLKASAGASENIAIFSVNKPAGFLVDSKEAGWKVYAAVAPSGRQDPDVPETLTTDQLNDPLSESPCILMLGGEGEGLRWNLRSKADVDLSVRGGDRTHNVDSLNVSVAAGILCSSFLSKSNAKETPDPTQEEVKVDSQDQAPVGDLF